MLALLKIVVHTMQYEYRAARLQISVLPRCGTGEYPGPHVRLRPICVQLGFAAAHRCVLRTSAAHWLRGNLQAAHGTEAGTGQDLAFGMQQRRVAAIPQQSRYGIQEFLSGPDEIPDVQEAQRQTVGALYHVGFSLEERPNLAGENGSAAEYPLESSIQRHPVQCHHQQRHSGSVFHFDFGRGIHQPVAGQRENGRHRFRAEGCRDFERRDENPQSHLSAQCRTEVSPRSTALIPQTERLEEPRQGQDQGSADSRQNCGSAAGLAAQAHHKDCSRKPSDQRGEPQDQEHGQKSLPSQIHFGCRLGRDRSPTGIQIQLVRTDLCSDRPVVSQQQTLLSVWQSSGIAELGYPRMALPGLWRTPRPGYQCRNQHFVGGPGDSRWSRPVAVARKNYGGTRRTLSLRSLSQTPMGQSQRSIER